MINTLEWLGSHLHHYCHTHRQNSRHVCQSSLLRTSEQSRKLTNRTGTHHITRRNHPKGIFCPAWGLCVFLRKQELVAGCWWFEFQLIVTRESRTRWLWGHRSGSGFTISMYSTWNWWPYVVLTRRREGGPSDFIFANYLLQWDCVRVDQVWPLCSRKLQI